uniref:Uncharacterized protein n=1 Tax=Myoviridae sp. ctcyQ27 TaxID=2825139 RepID=A0A8S5UFI2_9CAUD|nr:MAG TPA: hypothetical protein [Myoviridae sp. ctcyQ27]
MYFVFFIKFFPFFVFLSSYGEIIDSEYSLSIIFCF